MKKKLWIYLLTAICTLAINTAFADVSVPMHLAVPKGEGKLIGTITLKDTKYGLLLTPNLSGLAPGEHGFHVHQNPSCEDSAMAAGDHLDPTNSHKHQGPYETGHLGDLPALAVDKDGNATMPVLAPRLKIADVINHSLMIHAGGDNYSDNPKAGGGGTRIVCGVIKENP